jgi:hypothetical protein
MYYTRRWTVRTLPGGFSASSSIGSGSGSSRSTGPGGTSGVRAPVAALPRGSDAVFGGWGPVPP